jgi:hypothetical protein
MGEQQLQQVARRPVGGLQPGGQKQAQERDDRFVGELLAVDLRGDRSPMTSSVILLRRWSTWLWK